MKPADFSDQAAVSCTLANACLEDRESFRALQAEWNCLHASCPRATPFNSWAWLFSWWQAYGSGKRLQLLTWRLEGTLIAVAPLCLAAEKSSVGTQARVLRMVGDDSGDSDYLEFLIHPDFVGPVLRHFGEWLWASRVWDVLMLRELPPQSPFAEALLAVAKDKNFLARMEYGRCGAVRLPQTFQEFLGSRQPRFRTKLRALLKKIDQNDLVFEAQCPVEQLRERLRSLYVLHGQRWRAVGQRGVFENKAKRRFYRHFVPRFARSGWLRLYSLRKGQRYVAHQLCFGAAGSTYLLQEGFDVSDPAASYGQMLRAAVMRHLIEGGENRYDFLGGFSRHKEDWGAQEETSASVVLARQGWNGCLYLKLPVWREQSAAAAKRWLPEAAVRMLKRTRAAL